MSQLNDIYEEVYLRTEHSQHVEAITRAKIDEDELVREYKEKYENTLSEEEWEELEEMVICPVMNIALINGFKDGFRYALILLFEALTF
ncbi:hypothetical protein H8S37_04385 [Mediterraneibacter sp. NSJ-55]|uniref:Uncharacterized protein n=1 Tax=Mediterraneibacter hominis TaxID=2763054 RepID=A0A923RP91_9FIRM|nr:hypothetical protein [Mediterraneibacter hominis]MBC5688171.1 hypothetical protein [Mediterraneibacter hominis]